MYSAVARRFTQIAIATLALCCPFNAQAGDQILSCQAKGSQGPEVRVLISEGFFSKGRIYWPAPSGTTTFEISQKSAVSYTAEHVPTAADARSTAKASPEVAGSLYINRLNGELHYSVMVGSDTLQVLGRVCRGEAQREQCAQQLSQSPAILTSLCYATIDCGRLTEMPQSRLEANYSCKRSFKKF